MAAAIPAAASADSAEEPGLVPGEVIVRFAAGSTPAERHASLAAVDARASEPVDGVAGARVLDLPTGGTVGDAIRRLEARGSVTWAEPNYILHPQQLPNDPLLGLQWGVRNVGQNSLPIEGAEPVFGVPGIDVDVAAAWDRSTGGGGPVAIVDTGIDPTHPDLAPNLNSALSRNFVARPSLGPDPPVDPADWADVHGHGTHVAGIVAAVGNNGLGVTGVNWRSEVAAIRVCSPNGECRSADVAAGLAYAGAAGIPVANVSLGDDETTPPDDIRIIREAIAAHPGTLFVAAASNDSHDVDLHPEYPCSFDLDNVVCVAALASDGSLASFSNWGARTVDLAAPGGYIESTFVNRLEPFFEDFAEGLDNWDQSPYPWEEGEVDDEPTLSFHGLDGGVPTPVPSASATLATGLDLSGGGACWAKVGLILGLHGNQTFAIEAGDEGGASAPLPPRVYDADSLPPSEQTDVAAYLNRLDGGADVSLSFVYRANGTETPLPSIDINLVEVTCVGHSNPGGAYKAISGTSQATPFVAGIASLGRSVAPGVSATRLHQALLTSSVPTPSLSGKTVSGGRVSAKRLLDTLAQPTPPSTPLLSPALPAGPRVGRLKRNLRKGVAHLQVFVPGPGEIGYRGKGERRPGNAHVRASRHLQEEGIVWFKVKPGRFGKRTTTIRRRLKRGDGKAKVKVFVTYRPAEGAPLTSTRTLLLVRRPG